MASPFLLCGAGGGNRTRMGQSPLDFESSASTSFTTPAIGAFIGDLPEVVNTQVMPVAR